MDSVEEDSESESNLENSSHLAKIAASAGVGVVGENADADSEKKVEGRGSAHSKNGDADPGMD